MLRFFKADRLKVAELWKTGSGHRKWADGGVSLKGLSGPFLLLFSASCLPKQRASATPATTHFCLPLRPRAS